MEKLKMEDDKIAFPKTRSVLWVLVFFGFAVNYMIRINLNIAIVDMVRTKPKNLSLLQSDDCAPSESSFLHKLNRTYEDDFNRSTTLRLPESLHLTTRSHMSQLSTKSPEDEAIDGLEQKLIYDENMSKFPWNEYHQGLVLGAFFWLHWLTQVPGGILAGKYGTKLIFGLSNFAGVLCCFAIPTAAYMGYKQLIFVRTFQGIVSKGLKGEKLRKNVNKIRRKQMDSYTKPMRKYAKGKLFSSFWSYA